MATGMDRPVNRRRRYLISWPSQLKYVGLILLLMFLIAALCSYVVYYSSMILMGEKLAGIYPEGRLMAIVKTVNFRIILSVILISPLVAVIGVFLSHRIAGPIYRMEKALADMAAGDLSTRIVLRKNDELGSLANAINKVTEGVRLAVVDQKEKSAAILNELDALKKTISSTPQTPSAVGDRVKILEKEMKEFAEVLNKYKL